MAEAVIKKVAEKKDNVMYTEEQLKAVVQELSEHMLKLSKDMIADIITKGFEKSSDFTDKVVTENISLKDEIAKGIIQHQHSINELKEKIDSLELKNEVLKRKMYLFNPYLLMLDNCFELTMADLKRIID